MTGQPNPMQAVLEAARSDGRETLTETEALVIAAALGVRAPAHRVVVDSAAAAGVDLESLPGERVVVKAMVPGLAHKTETGAVVVVAKDTDAVVAAIEVMAGRFPDTTGFLVAEYVEHEPGPVGEFLLGMHWTDEFGPVVTFGLGGTATEMLAELAPGRSTAVFSPALRGGVDAALDGCAATRPLIEGFRGTVPSCDRADLEGLIGSALDLAAEAMPGDITEFEINPLVFTGGVPMALDAFCRVGPAPVAEARPDLPAGAVAGLLRPENIGIVGVSERMNLGRVILRNLLAAGFPAESVTVVKPDTDEIDGVRCVEDVESMGRVDVLVIAVGAEHVPGLIEQVAASRAAGSVILIPGGVGEREGSEGIASRVAAALEAAPQPRPVINGANCMGIRSVPGSYDTTFIPAHKMAPRGREGKHPVALVSQSGAFVISRLDRLPWLDPLYLITVGNQMDLTVGDHLDHLADDSSIEVVACYVEGFRPGDGLRWARAAARMRARGGRVILYRGGRTAVGADSAASHTAAVAGDARVADALAAAAGVLVAESLEEFEDLLRLTVLLRGRETGGWGLGAVSNAGFEAVTIADRLGRFHPADLSPATAAHLGEILEAERLGGVVGARNPLDLTPNCGAEAYAEAVATVLADPGVDAGLVGCVPLTPSLATLAPSEGHDEDVGDPGSLASRLVALWESTSKPWAAVIDAGDLYDPMAHLLEEGGIPTFRTADRALRALDKWAGGN